MPDWKLPVRERLAPAKLDPISESELVEELAQDLEQRYQELRANGVPEEECNLRVLTELRQGDLPVREIRRRRRLPAPAQTLGIPAEKRNHLAGLSQDLKVGFRNLRTKRAFSLMVIGLLALGIAGNAAVFSVFNGLFLRPLPFPESGRLVDLDETAPKWNLEHVGVSNFDFFEWRKSNATFDSMAFFRNTGYNFSDGGAAQRVDGVQVTREMLQVLRLAPLIGRNFSSAEDEPGGSKVVLLSYGLWLRMFQGRDVLGRVVKLDEEPYTIIGVLPRDAVFPDRAELWTPLAADPSRNSGYYVNGVGRLKDGVSIGQARADLLRIHKAMIAQGHKVNEITSPILVPLRDRYLGDFKIVSRVLLAGVGVLLLVACVNIAALMMVRGASRSREIAIRMAIGASRRRIVVQLLTENLVLASIGGLVGVLVGEAFLRALVPALSDKLPQWVSFAFDLRFVVFSFAITAAAALLFGLVPALQTAGVDIQGSLQDSTARATPSRSHRITLGALVVCEIGLALTLSIGAGLLVQALHKVMNVDPGFRPENVLTFRVSMPEKAFGKPQQRIAYYDTLLARLRALPGVKAAGATSAPPLGGQWGGVFQAEGVSSNGAQNENPTVLQIAVMPGYFDAIGMTLLEGRTFGEQDGQPTAAMAAIVNQTFARHFWGNQSPIGKHIRRPGAEGSAGLFNSWYQVVGLLRDEKHNGLDQRTAPSVFLPYAKALLGADSNDARSLHEMSVILRGSLDLNMFAGEVREVMRQLDPDITMYGVQTMTEQLDRSLWARRAYSWLVAGFAIVALVLAAVGVYGVVSYAVTQRVHEIGIRMALGARPTQVLAQVLLRGLSVVSLGIAIGLLGALWATRLLQSLLFGVSSRDPLIYATIALVMIGVGLLANFVPAFRAAKVHPMRALRFD